MGWLDLDMFGKCKDYDGLCGQAEALNIKSFFRFRKLTNFVMAENTCPVCTSGIIDMVEPITTSCGHMFCWGCIYMVSFKFKKTNIHLILSPLVD